METSGTVNADCVGSGRLNVAVTVELPLIARDGGVKLRAAVTDVDLVAGLYPEADADTFAVPTPAPVIRGCVSGTVLPAGMKTVTGETDTTDGLLVVMTTVMPPAGAEIVSETASGVF